MMPQIVQTVARKAERGLRRVQEILRHRAVGIVAEGTALDRRGVFEGPWAHIVLMAAGAEPIVVAECDPTVLMRIMTPEAAHASRCNRVLGGKAEPRGNLGVAAEAKARNSV